MLCAVSQIWRLRQLELLEAGTDPVCAAAMKNARGRRREEVAAAAEEAEVVDLVVGDDDDD